jgi:cobaltochelatase CobT
MAEQSPLESFKQVLTGTARAIAREPEIELAFTADAPTQVGKNFRVPMPGRSLPPEQVAEARGFADSMALRLRHHNDTLHMANRPREAMAGAVFDAVETARVEAIGSRAMAGVRANLGHALDMRMRSDPIARAQAADEVPLPTAISLLVRERLTGEAAPAAAIPGLAMVRDWIEDKGGADLDALVNALDDQKAFADLAQKLLRDLELTRPADEPEPTDEGEDESSDEEEGADQSQQDGDEGDSQQQMDARAEQSDGEGEDGEEQEIDSESDMDGDAEPGDEGEEGMLPVRPNRPMDRFPAQLRLQDLYRRPSTRSSPPPICATRMS